MIKQMINQTKKKRLFKVFSIGTCQFVSRFNLKLKKKVKITIKEGWPGRKMLDITRHFINLYIILKINVGYYSSFLISTTIKKAKFLHFIIYIPMLQNHLNRFLPDIESCLLLVIFK